MPSYRGCVTRCELLAVVKASQGNDPNLKVIVEAVEIGVKLSRESISKLPSSVKVLLGHWDQLEV